MVGAVFRLAYLVSCIRVPRILYRRTSYPVLVYLVSRTDVPRIPHWRTSYPVLGDGCLPHESVVIDGADSRIGDVECEAGYEDGHCICFLASRSFNRSVYS